MPVNFKKLFWDTGKAGNERARLTPWLYEEHKSFVEAQLKFVETEQGEEVAKQIAAAYAQNEADYFEKHPKCEDCKPAQECGEDCECGCQDEEVVEEVEEEEVVDTQEEANEKEAKKTKKKSSPKK